MAKQTKLEKIWLIWDKHIRETPGHTPTVTQGGKATYDVNVACTYIRCCACGWEYTVPERAQAEGKIRRG